MKPAGLILLSALLLPVLVCRYNPLPPSVDSGPSVTPVSDSAVQDLPVTESAADRFIGESGPIVTAPLDAGRPDVVDAPPLPDVVDAPSPPLDRPRACVVGQRMACYGGPPGTADVGACRSGERVCAADGTWGTCLGEQRSVAEVCNGLDEDCDAVADNGCPLDGALLRIAQKLPPSPVMGSLTLAGAVTFTHACPDGEAIVAFSGNYGSGIDSLGVRCGKLQIREVRSAPPYRYELLVTPGQEIAPRGGTGGIMNGVDQQLRCPPGEVIVGLSVWLDPLAPQTCSTNYCPFTGVLCPSVYGLTVSCAAYELAGSPGNFRVLRKGAAHTTSARIGGVGGVGEVENPYACPADGMMGEMNGAFGVWPLDCGSTVINGLQVICNSRAVPSRMSPTR